MQSPPPHRFLDERFDFGVDGFGDPPGLHPGGLEALAHAHEQRLTFAVDNRQDELAGRGIEARLNAGVVEVHEREAIRRVFAVNQRVAPTHRREVHFVSMDAHAQGIACNKTSYLPRARLHERATWRRVISAARG